MSEGRPTPTRWCERRDREAMAEALAGAIAESIRSALAARDRAIVALAGGRTPWPAYARLAEEDLDWARVLVIPTDDRLVPLGDALSNVTAMARIFEPRGARVEALADPAHADPHAAGRSADARLRGLPWPLDFVLLGVGGDGHTASIFPGEDFAAAVDPHSSARALGVTPEPLPPEAPVARVSLSLAAIARARTVALAATGSGKRAVIEAAIEAGDDSPLPLARVLAALAEPVRIYWAPQ